MKRALFIHRSVGHHLLQFGKLRQLLNDRGIALDDYDNNSHTLTYHNGEVATGLIEIPENNTNSINLVDFFAQWPAILNDYDLIVFKSCYTSNHIKNDLELGAIERMYGDIFNAFIERSQRLLMLTAPPLRPIRTTRSEARLASELADWSVELLEDNVFDLFHYLAEPHGYKGALKSEYRRTLPWDSHPNNRAHEEVAPLIADRIAQVIQSPFKPPLSF